MTIYKVYKSYKAAERFIDQYMTHSSTVRIDEVDGKFFVISGHSGYQS